MNKHEKDGGGGARAASSEVTFRAISELRTKEWSGFLLPFRGNEEFPIMEFSSAQPRVTRNMEDPGTIRLELASPITGPSNSVPERASGRRDLILGPNVPSLCSNGQYQNC